MHPAHGGTGHLGGVDEIDVVADGPFELGVASACCSCSPQVMVPQCGDGDIQVGVKSRASFHVDPGERIAQCS